MYSRRVDPRTVKEQLAEEQLEADLESSPVKGAPIPLRLRNFRPDADAAVRALSGPPIWMRRLRAIEEATGQHERRLGDAWRSLAEEVAEPAAFAAAWRERAARWNFADVNELIDDHNRCFPIEARLPMDPRTRDYARVNGGSYEREPLGAEWILERFPPEHAAAA